MLLIRLVLLLAIAAGLVLFALSNLQPLSLTFLGIQTPVLPLALWILSAIAAGVLTYWLINALFGMSNYFTAREVRSQFRQSSRRSGQARSTPPASAASSDANTDADWRDWEGYEEPVDRKPPVDATADDDWDSELDDDWEGYESIDAPRSSASKRAYGSQEPSTSRNGSYSYGYRNPGSTGVGKAEPVLDQPVVDAEYRVIVPPYSPSNSYSPSDTYSPPVEDPVDEESADDWFEDDEDVKPDDRRPR